MYNKVVYTSLVGNYDYLKDPDYVIKGWDYICFSNNLQQENYQIWKIKPIPFKHRNKTRLSRFVKINPHLVLSEYRYSLWIDSNIQIKNNLFENRINELIDDETIISINPHPFRDCIYQEARICILGGLDIWKTIKKQVNFLKSNNFPKNYGLYENNIIFREHNNPKLIQLNENWWNLYLKYSKRDQLSLVYQLWKHNIKCAELMPKGISVRNHPGLKFSEHTESFFQKLKIVLLIRINKLFYFD